MPAQALPVAAPIVQIRQEIKDLAAALDRHRASLQAEQSDPRLNATLLGIQELVEGWQKMKARSLVLRLEQLTHGLEEGYDKRGRHMKDFGESLDRFSYVVSQYEQLADDSAFLREANRRTIELVASLALIPVVPIVVALVLKWRGL